MQFLVDFGKYPEKYADALLPTRHYGLCVSEKSSNFALVMKNQNRQQIVCDYIYDNLVQFGRLRHDVISNKVQIRRAENLWTDITTADVNDIVCDCYLLFSA